MEKVINKIEGRKFSLGKSYFNNNAKKGHPDSMLDIVRYWKAYSELPFEYSGSNWLYDAMIARQSQHGLQNDQYLTPDKVAEQIVELTNNFIPRENKVLNACCGIGQLTKYLLANKFDVFGFDNDKELVAVCRSVYPNATFFEYNFCQDNQILINFSKIDEWDLIVTNPPSSKINIISFVNWLSEALSDEGKIVILMHNGFEYKKYNKLYTSYIKRFKILCKEEIRDVSSNPKYAGMRIYLMELSEDYKKEREQKKAQGQLIGNDDVKNNIVIKEKTQLMESQDLKKIQNVRVDKIVINPLNPRKKFNESDIRELAQSIKEVGLLQAITLRKKDDKLEIVAGECRYRAFCLNGEDTIPAVIGEYTDTEVMFLALAENIMRNNLSAVEEANAFYYLVTDKKYTIEDLVLKFGKNETYIRNRLRLLLLIPDFKNLLENDELSIGASMELSKYSEAIQKEVYEDFYKETNSSISWIHISRKELSNRLIKRYTMTLADYEFSKDECRTCLYNTDTNTLFDECKGKCTNLECLRGKQRQYTLDMCKMRTEQDNFEIIISPTDRLNPDITQKLKEEGIEVKTSVTYETPEQPKEPRREDFKLECDYKDALDKYRFENLEYNADMDEYEKKVENGEYKRCLHIGGGNPKICYAPIKKEDHIKTVVDLEKEAKSNFEVAKKNIVRSSLELIRTKDILSVEFSVLEEEIFLFLMLGYINKKRFSLFDITDPAKEHLMDKEKEVIISQITNQQYGILKREFILKSLSSMNVHKLSDKLQIYLQSFAEQHFPEEAKNIVNKHLNLYTKSKEKLDKQISKLKQTVKTGS